MFCRDLLPSIEENPSLNIGKLGKPSNSQGSKYHFSLQAFWFEKLFSQKVDWSKARLKSDLN